MDVSPGACLTRVYRVFGRLRSPVTRNRVSPGNIATAVPRDASDDVQRDFLRENPLLCRVEYGA
jgi:hypothetical protein